MIILLPKGVLEMGPEESITINLLALGKVIIKSILHNDVISNAEREAAGTVESHRIPGRGPQLCLWPGGFRLSSHFVYETGIGIIPVLRDRGKQYVFLYLTLNSSGALKHSGVFKAPEASICCPTLFSLLLYLPTLCSFCH